MNILDNISSDDKNSKGDFTIVTSNTDRSIQGNIYHTETGKLVSSTFTQSSEIEYSAETDISKLVEGADYRITRCYEGAVIKIWKDENGSSHFSNTKNIDCKNSYWGNKEDTFEKLFTENGGENFMKLFETDQSYWSLTHHFMIMNKNLINTTRMDMRDNETIIIYLGSVNLCGEIFEIQNILPDIYYYHIHIENALPLMEELSGRILIPDSISIQDAYKLLQNGFEDKKYEEKEIPHAIFKGEPIVIKKNLNELIKIVPLNFEMRKRIAGNSPNVKNNLYRLLEIAKDRDYENYSSQFHRLGCLTNEEIETILREDPADTSFIINTFINREKRLNMSSLDDRMSNIVTNCLLFCPLTKVHLFIKAWKEYQVCRDVILKFLKRHNHDIRSGKYDEKLSTFHDKALTRIKNLAEISKIYASEKGSHYSYASRMEYSLKGALRKEFGPSLYRIEKAIRFLQE